MKIKYAVALISLLILASCFQNPSSSSSGGSEKVSGGTVIERLSNAMTDLTESGNIFLDKSTPSKTRYLLLDKDELSSGMDWLGYSLIEKIDNTGNYNIVTKYFLREGDQPGLAIRLINEPPEFSWSLTKGANLSADLSKFFNASIKLDNSYIYEFIISKVADFTVDKKSFDESSFNSTIFQLYMLSIGKDTQPALSGYDEFKRSYGVARGGSLYEVILNEYKSTTIDGETDISGLVKAKGSFYKKTGGSVKKTIFKLFYANAGPVDSARFTAAVSRLKPVVDAIPDKIAVKEAIKYPNVVSGGNNSEIVKLVRALNSGNLRF